MAFFYVFEKKQSRLLVTFRRCFCKSSCLKAIVKFTGFSGERWNEQRNLSFMSFFASRSVISLPPHMASFVMLKIAKEHKESASEASKSTERDQYVDYLNHWCPTTNDALTRILDVEKIVDTGGFQIKEWHCSSKQLQDTLSKRSKPASIKFRPPSN